MLRFIETFFPQRAIIHIVETAGIRRRNPARIAQSSETETASVPRVSVREILAETDLLGAGSPGAACADVGDLDVAPRQTRLPLQLAHGRVGCSAAGAHGPHYRLALGTTLAVSDPLPIDRALLVEAAFRRFAGILSCEIERPYDYISHRDYSLFSDIYIVHFFKIQTVLYI